MPSGGKRTPRNPAPVSGPGSLSRRTDGGPAKPQYVAGLPYGEGQEFMDVQTSAPMGGGSAVAQGGPSLPPSAPGSGPVGGASTLPGMGDPTQYPDESVYAGSDNPGGANSDALASRLSNQSMSEAQKFVQYLPFLESAANQSNSPDSFRRFVQYLKTVQRGA